MFSTMDDVDTDSDSDLDFAKLDLTGVNFDSAIDYDGTFTDADKFALEIEMETVASQWSSVSGKGEKGDAPEGAARLEKVAALISDGEYVDALRSDFAKYLFGEQPVSEDLSFYCTVRKNLITKIKSLVECVEAELIAVAAFNLFLQLNYTGPTFDMTKAVGINPHKCFSSMLNALEEDLEIAKTITNKRHTKFQNVVLAELACDGQWPFQVVEAPYLLLLARCILSVLANPKAGGWSEKDDSTPSATDDFSKFTSKLCAVSVWSARATVAHERLLLTDEPTTTLWKEIEAVFPQCMRNMQGSSKYLQSMALLEFGLACHHFNRPKKGKKLFLQAKDISGLFLELTGAPGKRTKFQQKATAQMVVRAISAPVLDPAADPAEDDAEEKDENIKSQMVGFNEDTILHDRVQFEDTEENQIKSLTILDQAILLGMCLDIKDNNPADRLTAEEMSAFLARVLCHHDDWIVYSTALLERAWLEFDGNHTKERAVLQMQALADQHTDRLTITQSTRQSIEDSSPVQDRVKNLHSIVYPPRWEMLRDVAERYASLGIVTSAAEIYTEIESWDEVVECYRRAGKEKHAEEIVRERLSISETPRMWTALGDITNEPEHWEKAVKLSHGRFSQAYISLGKHYFDANDPKKAVENYREALRLRPHLPSVWFRVGAISMQQEDWDGALTAFTEVVQQTPEEAEAWANVAAIHMHNKRSSEAYPALNESLKQNRSNWRVWVSKLYTCLDLEKFDEAAQACHALLELKSTMSSQNIPDLEEKCVRAIVGGTIKRYTIARDEADELALDPARRSLVRVQELLDRLKATKNAPWVFETTAYLHEQVGHDTEVYENLMKEYRSLTSVRAWEKDDSQVIRVCRTVSQIVHYQQRTKEDLTKSKFLLSGVVKKVTQSRVDGMHQAPKELENLKQLLSEIATKLSEQ